MPLSITAVYTAIFAIMIIPLSFQVTLRRIAIGNVAAGDAEDGILMLRRETLRNFCEYVPIGLLLLAIYEYTFGSTTAVVIFGGMFLFSRVFHVIGFQFLKSPRYFAIAMTVQHTYFIAASGELLYELVLK